MSFEMHDDNESPRIILSDEKRKEVQSYLDERKQRLNELREEDPNPYDPDDFNAPEQAHSTFPSDQRILRYEIALCERILKTGEAVTWEISRELAKKDGGAYSVYAFAAACKNIVGLIYKGSPKDLEEEKEPLPQENVGEKCRRLMFPPGEEKGKDIE